MEYLPSPVTDLSKYTNSELSATFMQEECPDNSRGHFIPTPTVRSCSLGHSIWFLLIWGLFWLSYDLWGIWLISCNWCCYLEKAPTFFCCKTSTYQEGVAYNSIQGLLGCSWASWSISLFLIRTSSSMSLSLINQITLLSLITQLLPINIYFRARHNNDEHYQILKNWHNLYDMTVNF